MKNNKSKHMSKYSFICNFIINASSFSTFIPLFLHFWYGLFPSNSSQVGPVVFISILKFTVEVKRERAEIFHKGN